MQGHELYEETAQGELRVINEPKRTCSVSMCSFQELKKNHQIWFTGWGCSSIAEHLPSMYEALGSIPSTTKTKGCPTKGIDSPTVGITERQHRVNIC